MRLIMIGIGVLVGYLLGYWLGAYLACEVLDVWGNLCGFVGIFCTGPIGMLVGGVIAYYSTKRM